MQRVTVMPCKLPRKAFLIYQSAFNDVLTILGKEYATQGNIIHLGVSFDFTYDAKTNILILGIRDKPTIFTEEYVWGIVKQQLHTFIAKEVPLPDV